MRLPHHKEAEDKEAEETPAADAPNDLQHLRQGPGLQTVFWTGMAFSAPPLRSKKRKNADEDEEQYQKFHRGRDTPRDGRAVSAAHTHGRRIWGR